MTPRTTMVVGWTTTPGKAVMAQHTAPPCITKVVRRKMGTPIVKVARQTTLQRIPVPVRPKMKPYIAMATRSKMTSRSAVAVRQTTTFVSSWKRTYKHKVVKTCCGFLSVTHLFSNYSYLVVKTLAACELEVPFPTVLERFLQPIGVGGIVSYFMK